MDATKLNLTGAPRAMRHAEAASPLEKLTKTQEYQGFVRAILESNYHRLEYLQKEMDKSHEIIGVNAGVVVRQIMRMQSELELTLMQHLRHRARVYVDENETWQDNERKKAQEFLKNNPLTTDEDDADEDEEEDDEFNDLEDSDFNDEIKDMKNIKNISDADDSL